MEPPCPIPRPRIAYLTWPATEITGGIKMAFRHVEFLNNKGFDAVIATPDGKSPGWFATNAPVIPISSLATGTDILVYPENNHAYFAPFAQWPNPKVVFCQSEYMAFRGLQGKRSYRDFGVSAIISCGWTTAWNCRRRFPDLDVQFVPNYIDPNLFALQPSKEFQIAFFPKKRQQEAKFIRDLFQAENPEFADVPWIELGKMSEPEIAKVFRESAVFLSLCRFEALPLTLLEAMSSGCITAGFTGFGARDFANAQNGFWAQEDDCVDCAFQLARACRLAKEGGPYYLWMVEQAVNSARMFDRTRFTRALVGFWREFIKKA